MLKLDNEERKKYEESQPPSGGCVLKPICRICAPAMVFQPPSGGCVLKHYIPGYPAAVFFQPPSGGCVLKQTNQTFFMQHHSSRLQAAVC